MRIGFIGAGAVASTMGRHLTMAGNDVVITSHRGPDAIADLIDDLGPRAAAGTIDDVLTADVVILAVNWVHAEEVLKSSTWSGQILVDAMNAHADYPVDVSLKGVTKSRALLAAAGRTSSELVAEWAPGARVVKAISNVPMAWIQDYSAEKPKTAFFTSGDDYDAKRAVMDLLVGAGFAAIDLGSLATGGALHEVGAPLSGVELHFVQWIRPESR